MHVRAGEQSSVLTVAGVEHLLGEVMKPPQEPWHRLHLGNQRPYSHSYALHFREKPDLESVRRGFQWEAPWSLKKAGPRRS